MQKNKIKLIYIVSNGRSGSTLLDLLLGMHSNIWTLGEFQNLPWELVEPRQACGCGTTVEHCSFWKDILRLHREELTNGNIHRFREKRGAGKVLRFPELFGIITWKFLSPHDKLIHEYGTENYCIISDVIRKARQEKDVQYVVDASKDPYRLFWLVQSGLFDIFAIHLVKDPRAFVYSMVKNDIGNSGKCLRMNVRYNVENLIIEKVLSYLPRTKKNLIRYEDLALKPEKTIKMIFEHLRISSSKYDAHNFRGRNHAISGNRMRHERSGIYLDQKWMQHLPERLQTVTRFICHFPGKKYRYW